MEDLFKQISQEKIAQYQAHLEKLELSEATIKRRLSALRKFYNWAEKEGYLEKPPQKAPIAKEAPSMPTIPFISDAYEIYHSISITKYLHYAILIIFSTALGFGIYQQFIARAPEPLAYPTALTRPNRYLSFQGRLTDSSNNPITTSTNFVFKLYDAVSAGNTLWNSGTCSITPDQDGIFSVILGLDCGAEIAASVFTENASVWLGITVGADAEATPRIQVATVAYALNAETLQGYPPGTGTSTVPYIDSTGKVVIAASSPTVQATSGTFSIEGQTGVTIQAASGQNGNITLSPKGTGRVVLSGFEASTGNLFDVQGGANIGGSGGKEANTIIYGYAGTNSTNLNLLKLEAGATPDAKFTVDASGNASAAGYLRANTTGSYFTGDVTVSGGTITGANSEQLKLGVTDDTVQVVRGASTYTVCDSSGNCQSATGGYIGGSGTANRVAKFTDTYTIGNSGINDLSDALAITIDSSENVGIGTTGPNSKLEVAGDIALGTNYIKWGTSASEDTTLYRSGADVLALGTDDDLVAQNTAGDVVRLQTGANASYLLATETVAGDWILAGGVSGDTQQRFTISAGGGHSWGEGGATAVDTNLYRSAANILKTDDSLYIATNLGVGYDPSTITNGVAAFNGNVGIGTTGPGALLHVSGSYAESKGQLYVNGTTHAYMGLDSATNSDAGIYLKENNVIKWDIFNDGNANDILNFNSAAGTKVTIQQDGNVGIGTTDPGAYKLNIAGTTMHQNAVYFANGTTYYVDASGNAKFLDLIATDTGNPGLTVGDGTTGYVKVGGSTISDAAGDLTLNSDSGNVTISDANIVLDDGSSTSYYIKTRSTTSPTNTTLYINNPGTGNANLNVEGDLTVTGNDILDAGGSSAITFDGAQNTAFAGNLTVQDDKWIGLGSSAGRIEFDGTPATDEVNILDANVGIGTTGPTTKLQVSGGTIGMDNLQYIQWRNAANSLWLNGINIDNGNNLNLARDANAGVVQSFGDFIVYDKAITAAKFYVSSSGGNSYFNTGGNVGIGTVSPDYPLQVNGTIAPETTDQDLGTTSLRWDLLANTINADSTITFTGLTANRLVATDGSSNLATSISSANAALSVTDETGSGLLVFGTSPQITTSLTTNSASFDLLNTTATTVNFAGAATALTIGATTGTATIRNATTSLTGNLTVSGTGTSSFAGNVSISSYLAMTGAVTWLGTGQDTGVEQSATGNHLDIYSRNDVRVIIDSLSNSADEFAVYANSTAGTKVFSVNESGTATATDFECTNCIDRGDISNATETDSCTVDCTVVSNSGGAWTFFPRSYKSADASAVQAPGAAALNTTVRTLAYIYWPGAYGGTAYVDWPYITASPPYFLDGYLIKTFTYFLWNKETGQLVQGHTAPDPPWRKGTMNEYPHPFDDYLGKELPEPFEIAFIDPEDLEIWEKEMEAMGARSLLELFHTWYEIDPQEYTPPISPETGKPITVPPGTVWRKMKKLPAPRGAGEGGSVGSVKEETLWGGDIAEEFETLGKFLEPGDIIVPHPTYVGAIDKSTTPYQKEIIGIISTRPSEVLNQETDSIASLTKKKAPVALNGVVPVKVSTINGPIKPGDPITSSSIPGVGMKATKAGPIVGKALEPYENPDPNAVGKIMVFINLSWYDPDVFLTDTGDLQIVGSQESGDGSQEFKLEDKDGNLITRIGAFAEAVIANLRVGSLQAEKIISPLIEVENLRVGLIKSQEIITEKLASKEIRTEKLISPLVESDQINTKQLTTDRLQAKESQFGKIMAEQITSDQLSVTGDATVAGTLYADKVVAREIVGLQSKFGELIAASISAQRIEGLEERLAQLETAPSATESGNPMEDVELSPDIEALVNEILNQPSVTSNQPPVNLDGQIPITELTVLGPTSLADTSIAGSLNVGGTMSLSDNSINALTGPLYLQNLGLGGIDILAGKIVIDEKGNVVFEGDVTIKGRLALSEIEPLPEGDLVINLESGFGKLLVKGIDDKVVASIDASGSARFAQVETQKIVIASDQTSEVSSSTSEVSTNATAGQAILPAGATEIIIKSQFVTDKTLIYVTPISSTQNKVLFVKAKKASFEGEAGWFKVAIDTPIGQDIEFNWWIIN